MRTAFDFTTPGRNQTTVSKDELFVAFPLLVIQADAFEIVNLNDGTFLIEYRSHNDNDFVLLKEHELSKKPTKKKRKINIVPSSDRPTYCEECGEELHEFSGEEAGKIVSGMSCDSCGWTWDDPK
jgi:hypothetical protein